MAKDDIQSRLDNARYGTPLVNPEEQHTYLGTFRERCALSMTIAQMKNKDNQQYFIKELLNRPDTTVLINGAAPQNTQDFYIQLAVKYNHRFTIVNDHVDNETNSIGLIISSTEAIDCPVIDVEKKYTLPSSSTKQDSIKNKQSFWHKLFH